LKEFGWVEREWWEEQQPEDRLWTGAFPGKIFSIHHTLEKGFIT
jgi:hypothetical protein